jgi:hypothetical protein
VKRPVLLLAVVAGATALGCACRQPTASPPVPATAPAAAPATGPGGLVGGPAGQTVARQYLVTVVAGAGEAAVREALAPFGLASIKPIGNDAFLVTIEDDPGLARVEALGKRDPRIKAVQPNFVYRAN